MSKPDTAEQLRPFAKSYIRDIWVHQNTGNPCSESINCTQNKVLIRTNLHPSDILKMAPSRRIAFMHIAKVKKVA